MRYINVEQAKQIHKVLVDFFEKDGDPISPSGVKNENLLESALFRPQTSLGNIEKYKTDDEKAGSLLCALIQNHPFHNGNKRTAIVCTLAFYDSCGHTINSSENDLYNFLIDIANGKICDISKTENPELFFSMVVRWLRKHRYSYKSNFSSMRVNVFANKCRALGAKVKRNKGRVAISCDGYSVTVNESNKPIPAIVIRKYYTLLHLSPAYTGLNLDELLSGNIENMACFSNLIPILRRLALV